MKTMKSPSTRSRKTRSNASRRVFEAVHRLLHRICHTNHDEEFIGRRAGTRYIALSCHTDRPWIQKCDGLTLQTAPAILFFPSCCELVLDESDWDSDSYLTSEVVDTVDYGDPELLKKVFAFLDENKLKVPRSIRAIIDQEQLVLSAILGKGQAPRK